MDKTQVEGRESEAKWKSREAAGKVDGDKTTEHKGKAEKSDGKDKTKVGDMNGEASRAKE